MARSSKSKRREPAPRSARRINTRALAVLGGLALAGLLAVFPAMMLSERAARRSAMAQIRASRESKNLDLALRGLERYTATWPDDIEGLEMRARLLAEVAGSAPSLLDEAARANDLLLRRLDPGDPRANETRLRLARVYILHSQLVWRDAQSRGEDREGAQNLRFQAAAKIAQEAINQAPKDVEARRLLAQALDGLAGTGGKQSSDEAIAGYRAALQLDPGDIASAERLATLELTRKGGPAAAEKTLDALLAARPKDPEARLARFRFFQQGAKDPARARAELDAALALAPSDPWIRITAADDAAARNDLAAARAHLDAIPAEKQDDPRIRLLRCDMDLQEQKPDRAIERFRQGLQLSGGTDQELTWRLARTLILLNRLAEARPVVDRFEKLGGDAARPMSHYLRGFLEAASDRPAVAIADLERAAGKTPAGLQREIQSLLGECYARLGNIERAKLAYGRAAAADPRSPEPLRAIARLQLQVGGDPRSGLGDLERALAKAPSDPALLADVGRARYRIEAAAPPENRDWAGFERFLDDADRRAPDAPALLTLRVEYLASTGRLDRATELAAAATRGPGRARPEPWTLYARMLELQGRRDAAIKAMEEAAAPDAVGDTASTRVLRAELLANAGRGQAARDLLTRDIDRIPRAGRPELYRALGGLLRGLGDRAGARSALAEWARLLPDSPRPGLVLMEMARADDDDEAARLGMEALRAVGGEGEPQALFARILDLLRTRPVPAGTAPADRPKVAPAKLEEARQLAERLKVQAPQYPFLPLVNGMIREQEGHFEEAIEAYKKALEGQTFEIALTGLLNLLADRKLTGEVDALRRRYADPAAALRDPAQAKSFDRIAAAVARRHGDKAGAELAAAKLVEMQPDNLKARTDLATILDANGKPEQATATFADLVARHPESLDAWSALVGYQKLRGATEEAARTIARIDAEYKGDRPDLLRGRCWWIVGDPDRAAKYYAEALKARPDDMLTLQSSIAFDEANGRADQAEPALRHVLKLEPTASWAARLLAQELSGRRDTAAWDQAWALVAPGSSASGDTPEDRLIRALVLARSPDGARRAEAEPALVALANDLPPSNATGVEARCRLAQAMLEAGRAEDARKSIGPAAEEARPSAVALALDAEALARTGRVEAAARRVDQLAAIEPKSARLATARAWLLHASGKPAEAAKVVEGLIAENESGPAGETYAVACHDLLSRMGQAADAERVAARIAARWPGRSTLLAHHQIARGDAAGALASCRAALDAGAATEAAREASALAVTRRNDPALLKEIDALMVAALARGPKTADLLVFVATLRHVQGRYEDEIALYREALALNPPFVKFLNNMAWTLSDGLDRHQEALDRIDEAIRRSGTDPSLLDTRGVILGRLGQVDRAIADLEESCRLEPSATSYFHLARAYLKAGRRDEAARYRDLARKAGLDPATLDPRDRADLNEVIGPS